MTDGRTGCVIEPTLCGRLAHCPAYSVRLFSGSLLPLALRACPVALPQAEWDDVMYARMELLQVRRVVPYHYWQRPFPSSSVLAACARASWGQKGACQEGGRGMCLSTKTL